MMLSNPAPADLRKLPTGTDTLLARGEWSYCAMEHSRIGAVELVEPGSPFHHLALPLGRRPMRLTCRIDGRRQHGWTAPDTLSMIEAGAAGTSGWDATMESACLYFTTAALADALGLDAADVRHDVRTRLVHRSPALARLIHALFLDAAAGQPHGTLVGDAVFVALATQLAPAQARRALGLGRGGEAWRVRNALAFVHAHLTDALSIPTIAGAAGTSPYYLNHAFRLALGCSIWRYVLRARARYALHLMQADGASLAGVAQAAGFHSYPAFINAFRAEFGCSPSRAPRPLG